PRGTRGRSTALDCRCRTRPSPTRSRQSWKASDNYAPNAPPSTGADMPKGIFLALANPVSEDVEDDFNAWYDASHAREVLALPGVHSCTRYALADPQLMPGDGGRGYGCPYQVEVDGWADFSKAMPEGFAAGKITINADLLSMDPMVKTIVFEQL